MWHSYRRFTPLLALGLLALTSCRDALLPPSAPESVPRPLFAQGDGGVWTVNSLADPGDGTCDDTQCTLREAIAAAASGDRIEFAAGLAGNILLTAGQLTVFDKALTIDGGGRIVVDAQVASRVLAVDGNGGPRLLTLKGLTVRNGFSGDHDGGGIRVLAEARLRLENVSVINNESQFDGGGIHLGFESDLELVNSTVDGNRARRGGGIHGDGAVTLITSTISRNIAMERGGGVYLAIHSVGTMDRSTVSGNRAGTVHEFSSRGGGIYLDGGTLQIRSSTISDNRSVADVGQGGGLFIFDGSVLLANTILAGNSGTTLGIDCDFLQGTATSLGYNLYTAGSAAASCFTAPGPGDVVLLPAQIFTEVLEPTLQDNGGPTETHALMVRGRAMDAGYCPGETADQRGLPRPVDIEVMANAVDGCDIGAYELQGPVVPRTDLMVSQTSDKSTVKAGDLLTYFVRVRNLGPETAPNVVLTNVLSSGVTFVSATHAKGTTTTPPVGETGTVTWYLGDLLDQANEVAEIKVTVRIRGKTTVDNAASVTADIVDINPANNSATLKVSVGAGGKNK